MSTQETTTYRVDIRLSTEEGELPTDVEVERLIADQMSGVLDEDTGLRSIAVFGIRRVPEINDEEVPEAEKDDKYYARALARYRDLRATRDETNDDDEHDHLTEEMRKIEEEIFS